MLDYDYVRNGLSPAESAAGLRVLERATQFSIGELGFLGYGSQVFVLPDGLGRVTRSFPNDMRWRQWPYADMKFISVGKKFISVSHGGGGLVIVKLNGSKADAKRIYDQFEATKRAGRLPNSLVVMLEE